ncbi:hypothetical protein F4818DRAFT_11786 [Hypoxylon cercidicola]|nr:hypothetical protein F4818DRAFT_11786 [Hypoxylon cercidicola]
MASINRGSEPSGLENLLPELAFKVMEHLSPTDLTPLLFASKHMREIFNANQSLMISILKLQPGIENLLYLYTAQKTENHPDRMLHPRIIDVHLDGPGNSDGPVKINMMGKNVKVFKYLSDVPLVWRTNEFALNMSDVTEIWHMAKKVDEWVEFFPRGCWRDNPEYRRCLRPAEEVRLRKAVSRWWLYSHHHHGFWHAWRSFKEPKKWDNDTRLNHIRRMATDEILELLDLWEFVREVVSQDLCSSPERICRCNDGYVVDLVPWGAEDGRHERIVSTYMKLTPDQLMYYLTHYSNWKKSVTVEAVTANTHLFTRDVETLSISIRKVLEERMLLRNMPNTLLPTCSIVDDTRDPEYTINQWTDDSWPDGKAPLTPEEVSALGLPIDHGALTRRGDDGSDDAIPH